MSTVTLSFRGILTSIAVLIVFGISTASASTYFLKIDGIDGESNDRTHRDWIDVDSFYWGITRNATVGSGSGGAAIGSPLSWTQQLDSSVPKLFSGVATGKRYSGRDTGSTSEGTTPNCVLPDGIRECRVDGIKPERCWALMIVTLPALSSIPA